MGNVQSGSTLTRTSGAVDSFVAELGNDVIYDKSLGTARFLKTAKCKHRNGFLVIKIFVKPDPGLSLRSYQRRLKIEREALADISNVYSYQTFVETDRAGYIIRQWIASNLYDRISTRPFLSTIEKKWISFQLLYALRDARNRKISHGDIKSQNVLVTSWNWVYLTDFASFKPVYLPLDDPSDFSFFFDTSGKRICYIAPERFYTEADNPEISAKKTRLALEDNEGHRDGKITEAMDCFSAGCVIAELFLEGAPLFTLSQLFKYREGEYDVDAHLKSIDDAEIRAMIKAMISLDPAARPSFDSLLHTSRDNIFPESFYTFFHTYVSSVNEMSASAAVSSPPATGTSTPTTIRPSASSPAIGVTDVDAAPKDTLPSDSDVRVERIWEDYTTVVPYLTSAAPMDATVDYAYTSGLSKSFQDVLPVEIHVPNMSSSLTGNYRAAAEDGPALIVLSLVTANVRNCALPSSKLRALDILLALSTHATDEAKLDCIVPYVVDLLHDDAPVVRASALRTLMQALMLVTVIAPSNAAIFPEYIIPNIRHLAQDVAVSVRCMYAQCIVDLADTAVRYLEMGQTLKSHGTFNEIPEAHEYDHSNYEMSYDASLLDLQITIQEHLATLLMDPSSVVKRAILHNISSLCIFLGRQKTNDVLLSHMITYLNDRDWMLRLAFFESIVDVAACAGGRSLEEYILPLMIQALSDVEESVVAKVLSALTNLCELGLFTKMRLWELMSATLGFLYHPDVWIRQGAAAFIASATTHLPHSDVWCILYPSLRHFLKSDIAEINEQSLLLAMKPPISRPIFDAAVQWAMKAEKSAFWRGQRPSVSRNESPRDSVVSIRKTGTTLMRNSKSDEDDAHISRLHRMGMTASEESKLLAMRDYILKLANANASFASRTALEVDTEKIVKTVADVELTKVGVVPQTIFLKNRMLESSSRSQGTLSLPSRRAIELSGRSPAPSSRSNSSWITSADTGYEDLRHRLASLNGSVASLNVAKEPRTSDSSLNTATTLETPSFVPRPVSPSDSVVSASTSIHTPSRLQMGSTDKAAPAVASYKTNVTGVLEAASRLRPDGSPERSGRSSPAFNAVRQASRRYPPSLPISTYDGQEFGVNRLLENLCLDNNRELQRDFGPKVHEGPVRRRNAVRHSFIPRDGTPRRPEATLIAHLTSHSDAITAIAVSPDHMFFVSASNDKTVKVWDTARLERNVTSKPRHTYNQHHARVKCVCILEGVHCFASAADDGSLHVVRIHIAQSSGLPKYNKLQVIREHRLDTTGEYITCMSHFNTDSASNLVYATTHSVITVLDLRTMRVLETMENPRHYGPITSMCIDRKRSWILVGTSMGVLTLWDRRFGLLLKSWHVGVAATGCSVRIHQCVIHPSKGCGTWVMVAVEANKRKSDRSTSSNILIEVWDIEQSMLVETFVSRATPSSASEVISEPLEMTGVDADNNPAAAIAALVRSRQTEDALPSRTSGESIFKEEPPPPTPDVRAIVVGTEFGRHYGHVSSPADGTLSQHGRGFVISGSEDRKIRFWDLGRIDRSAVLCGLDSDLDKPSYRQVTETSGSASTYIETSPPSSSAAENRPPQRMALITNNQQNLLKNHQDAITALCCIDSPFRGGLISGDRAGVLKVWRVDSTDTP
ncbi:hypothetical protein FISHEDRAFT_40447 [Fistulina hepatica ATCC 64428]|uniref:non-specific serine/threonine protein kinase n=1 Tax=Fistulina hepatica ATCC 64428 TaxID=1128425 RepID=A0A0D7AG67_9AGAR|nr:hypothetical protein FISHEDRAFT_40447 [Fistulina hepatica ATCC 64428]